MIPCLFRRLAPHIDPPVLKGLVRRLVEFFEGKMVRFWGFGGLLEEWDAEDLEAWGQVAGWLKMENEA